MKKFSFNKRYQEELLRSERKRALILILIFSAALVFRIINVIVPGSDGGLVTGKALSTLLVFPAIVIVFELLFLLYIDRKLKSDIKNFPLLMQYLNALIEVCVPFGVILLVASQYSSINILESPFVFIFFIYIILSTLRLNSFLSFLYGLLSAGAYTVSSIFLYNQFSLNDASRALILLFSGIAAGFVAKQIKSGIERSLVEAGKRHKAENLFSQQISAEVANQLLKQGGKMESKRMRVAVLFIDIRNFTQFTIDKSPEEIVCYQNIFFTIVIDTISRHGGIVNQILGDGCMATFGAPIEHHNPSEPAVKAAAELLQDIDAAVKAGHLHSTRVGIGIHTGEAVTGNIGNEERQQYSITGSVVIIASRIEQFNKQLKSQILISGEVMKNIEDRHRTATLVGSVSLKGYNEKIVLYKVA